MGMHLNGVKCKLLASSDAVIMDSIWLSFNRVDVKGAVLLGMPLFMDPILDQAWNCPRRLIDYSSLVPKTSSFCFEHLSVHLGCYIYCAAPTVG